MDRTTILDDCLARLKAGASLADCLSLYPEQAVELAPMLAAAVQLQGLSAHALSDAQRLRAKVILRETLASRSMPHAATSWLGLFGRAKGWAVAGAVALVLFAVLSVGAVAASQPGDLTYGVRVAAERAPALLLRDPVLRADAELDAADRRLTDVRNAFQSARPAAPLALEALIAGDEAVAAQASRLSEPARLQAAARVEAHAATLSLLAESAPEAHAAEALAATAARARVIAARVRAGQPGIPPPAGRPTITAPAPIRPTPTSPSVTPATTALPTPMPAETSTPTPQATRSAGAPTQTSTPDRRPLDGTREPSATRLPLATETRPGRATEIAATLTALPSRTVVPPRATSRPTQTVEPRPPTGAPSPVIETPRSERTATPGQHVTTIPRTPPPPPLATRAPVATSAPPPSTPGGGPPPTAPGPGPNPEPTRGGRP